MSYKIRNFSESLQHTEASHHQLTAKERSSYSLLLPLCLCEMSTSIFEEHEEKSDPIKAKPQRRG